MNYFLDFILGVNEENETLIHAFIRKMLPKGEIVVDKQTGRNILSSEGRIIFHTSQLTGIKLNIKIARTIWLICEDNISIYGSVGNSKRKTPLSSDMGT